MQKLKALDSSFTAAMTAWYRKEGRDLPWRRTREPYHIWVSEIMLQQTRVEAVREYYARFMQELPDIKALAAASEDTLLKLWQGLGYYNRVRNMHKAAVEIVDNFCGEFPCDFTEIRNLSGIGDYTAGAIASICFDQRVPAVDGNVLRVMSRITENYGDIKSQKVKREMGQQLKVLYPESGCGDFTQALIELGALICVPKGAPKCDLCPAAEFCQAKANGTVLKLPVKAAKKERKQVRKTVFVLRCGDKTAVRKRGRNGLLSGLYEFPNADEEMTAGEALMQAEEWGCQPLDLTRSMEATHVFSHVEWEMTAYFMTVSEPAEDFLWVTDAQMEEEIAIPSAFGYFK